jgi:hypothetical protein
MELFHNVPDKEFAIQVSVFSNPGKLTMKDALK